MAWYKMKRFTRIVRSKKRKNSAKGDKGLDVDVDTDGSEYGCVASNAPRIQAKMSLLGSTSFCCASGQKEDYVPDAKIVPAVRPPKKRPPNVNAKKDQELSTPKSPLLAAGRNFLSRSKKGKVSQENSEEIPFLPTETTPVKPMPEDTRPRPIENKLRPPDDRKKITLITPPSPQRRLQREPAIPRKDHNVDAVKKYSDAIRKYRNESSNQISMDSIKKCKHANNDGGLEPGNVEQKIEGSVIFNKDLTFGCGDALNKSHESEDFDCPCCDRTSVMLDEAGLSDIEVKMFTSCDVIAPDPPLVKDDEDIKDTSMNGELALQNEVLSLKEDLKSERLKLQTQQDRVQRLEDELSVMLVLHGHFTPQAVPLFYLHESH